MAEPDWSNISAVRTWVESRYPIGNGQTVSPFYQYLKDEKAKGNKIRGRETHLSRGPGGEFSKWVFENTEGDNAFYYPQSSMRVTYYPEYANPPTPDSEEDEYFTTPSTPPSPKEPDWSNVDAVRRWLGSCYPNSNNETGSPFYQYLKDELKKGRKLRGREAHLSTGDGGEFLKFIFENSGDNAVYFPSMRVTYFPEYVDPPSPDTDEDDVPKPKRSQKRARSEKAKPKPKRSLKPPRSAPNPAKPRRRKPPPKDRELLQIQERLSTLRPRHNSKVRKINE